MTGKKIWFGILVMTLVFGMAGIENIYSQSNPNGTLTVTDIPSRFNGKYIFFIGENWSFEIIGAQSLDQTAETGTGARIVNGNVSIPVWIERAGDIVRYAGSQTFDIEFIIIETALIDDDTMEIAVFELEGVTFTNGNASASFHDYVIFDEDF
ncbi:MAG: hypothetical protein FWG89_01170 [Treponema sp.]|nr:hypothetical protein [Treponema sp.]